MFRIMLWFMETREKLRDGSVNVQERLPFDPGEPSAKPAGRNIRKTASE
jgi:hypothetical protein